MTGNILLKIIKNELEAARLIASELVPELRISKKVLWLVPGGSAIKVAVEAAKIIKQQVENTNELSITLTDERYGSPGHAYSNYQQLIDAGFSIEQNKFFPVLNGGSVTEDTNSYSLLLDKLLSESDYKIGLFGIGSDYHTAGIKPNSPAVSSEELAVHYQGEDYERITMTAKAIGRLDAAVTYAVGACKIDAINKLALSSDEQTQPMQSLKRAGKLVILNDQIGN